MFREELMINERLCWRGSPTSQWQAYTQEQLSLMLAESRRSQLVKRTEPVETKCATQETLTIYFGRDRRAFDRADYGVLLG